MAITRTRQRASLLGKQYQSIVQQVIFTLLPCYVKRNKYIYISILLLKFKEI